ncbi:MAG: hypothetical protein K1X48_04015 [Burkholderiaceae bacterium]|nr:hypothetical protein [Burkholderiaceae bacterium]
MPDLTARIHDWLVGTGFPLEMCAASAFRSVGFEVRQASTYSDPQTDKGREIDVLAVDPDIYGFVEISIVIECKASTSPWVALVSDDTLVGYNRLHAMGVSSSAGKSAVFAQVAKTQGKRKPKALELSDRCGYGLRQAFSKDHDPAYAACVNVLKACAAIASDRAAAHAPRLAFAFPVLVVDSPIFECELTENDQLSLKEVSSTSVLFSSYLPEPVSSCIRIVRSTSIERTATELKATVDDLRSFLGPEQEEIIAKWMKS